MQDRHQLGFTLIELMLVVTIIGILAAIAIPSYLNYATRTKVTEGLGQFSIAKRAITEFEFVQGRFPDNNAEAGLSAPADYDTQHVETMTVGANGVVTLTFDDPALATGSIVFTPSKDSAGRVRWVCSTDIPYNLVPSQCRN